jgi:surface polysaccharide O-acyltransferase-like enzyme
MLNEKKNYIFWLDLIRIISIFMVVVIHTASPLYNNWTDLPLSDWMAGNVYNSIARVSVPLLFMVSGYLLLNRQEDIPAFFINRARKVALPLLAWSVIYLLWLNHGYANFTFINALKAMTYATLTSPVYYHLWFLYALLTIYLVVPILRALINTGDETIIRYFALTWLLFVPVLDYVENSVLNFDVSLNLVFFNPYLGYFYMGYIIGRMNFSRRAAGLAGLTYIALTVYTIFVTYKWSVIINDYMDYYHYYVRLNIVVMTFAMFVLLKYVGEKLGARLSERALKWMRHLSACTFGVYLIHAMLLTTLRNGVLGFKITALSASPFIMIPALAALVFLVSYAIIAILQRIPYVRAIVPG